MWGLRICGWKGQCHWGEELSWFLNDPSRGPGVVTRSFESCSGPWWGAWSPPPASDVAGVLGSVSVAAVLGLLSPANGVRSG